MKDFGKVILGIVLCIIVFAGIGFSSGEIQAFYNKTTGVHVTNSETVRYHSSKPYVDGMIQDLSRYKLELAQTQDQTARAAIIAHINEQFANFDIMQINDMSLRQFLNDVRNGNVK